MSARMREIRERATGEVRLGSASYRRVAELEGLLRRLVDASGVVGFFHVDPQADSWACSYCNHAVGRALGPGDIDHAASCPVRAARRALSAGEAPELPPGERGER